MTEAVSPSRGPEGRITRSRPCRTPARCLPLRDARGRVLCEIIPVYISPAEAAARAAQALYGLDTGDVNTVQERLSRLLGERATTAKASPRRRVCRVAATAAPQDHGAAGAAP